ncbi:MAG: NUDIX domain-containing protein [Patescibacteria group bacterium]
MKREKSAGAVIFYREGGENYYLLLNYKASHWDFPKGHIEKGEKVKETILREVEEETDLTDINFVQGFEEKIKYFFRKSYGEKKFLRVKPLIFKEVVFLLAKTKEKKVKISFEHRGFEWLGYEYALKKLTFKNAKKILERAHQFLLNHDKKD